MNTHNMAHRSAINKSQVNNTNVTQRMILIKVELNYKLITEGSLKKSLNIFKLRNTLLYNT